MHFRKLIFIAMLLLAASTAIAQQDSNEPGTIEEDIQELLKLTNAVKMGDQMLDQIFGTYEKMIPNVPAEIWQKARKEMRTTDLIGYIVPIYAKHFNRNDIRGLINFYKSPLGKKMIDNQEPILRESMAIGMAWGQEVSRKIASDLKSKGYKVPNNL
ncbi:MAG: DUF2059 domain-containing protein [bacterium]|jgi:hypothetical protein